MSHFTVMIIGDDVEGQLAPYHEFECTGEDNQYIQDIDITKHFLEEYLNSGGDDSEVEFAENWYNYEPVPFGEDPDLEGAHKFGYVELSKEGLVTKAVKRTNPNKKWDWYQIGGHWSGMLKIKDGGRGAVGSAGFFGTPAAEGYADQARKGDIDFESMYFEAEKKANDTYDLLEKVTAGVAPPPTWEQILEDFSDITEAREYRRNHPWVQAINTEPSLSMFRDEVKAYCIHSGGRNRYIEKSRCAAVTTFAVVRDGQWYQKGEMGWFACVSNAKNEHDWAEEFMKLLDGLPDDTLLTIVDCHI